MSVWEQIWARANKEEIGIAIKVPPEDFRRIMRDLYATKGGLDFRICLPGGTGEIWLVRTTTELTNGTDKLLIPGLNESSFSNGQGEGDHQETERS